MSEDITRAAQDVQDAPQALDSMQDGPEAAEAQDAEFLDMIRAGAAASGIDPDAARALGRQGIAADAADAAAAAAQQPTAQTTQPQASGPQYVDRADAIAQETAAAMLLLGSPTLDDIMIEDKARRIRGSVLKRIRSAIKQYNANQPKDDQLNNLSEINNEIFYQILVNTGDLALLVVEQDAEEPGRIIAYQHTGSSAGIWRVWNPKGNQIGRLKKLLGLTGKTTPEMLYNELKARLPERKVTLDTKDHAFVTMRNGVVKLYHVAPIIHGPLDWEAGQGAYEFTPYLLPNGKENPEYARKYGRDTAFTWTEKWDTDFNPNAGNKILIGPDGYKWSVDQHFEQTFPGKPGDAHLVWEIINFALRGTNGGVYWIWTDGSENLSGGGGKSTTAEMVRQTLGPKYVAEAGMDEIGSRFGAAIMDGKRALISNETNANHKPIENSQRIKQLSRQETIAIEQKNRDIFYVKFTGMTIQCTNGDIKFAEKSESVWRKHKAIPFPVQYDNPLGDEQTQRDYIKDDFTHRREVREYVAYKALSLGLIDSYTKEYMNANEDIIRKMRAGGSSVFTFLDEITPQFLGDRIPVKYLGAIYPAWCRLNNYRNPANASTFQHDAKMWATDRKENWAYVDQARLKANGEAEPVLGYYWNVEAARGWTAYENGKQQDAPRKWSKEARQKTHRGILARRTIKQPQQTAAAEQTAPGIPPIILYQLYAAQVSSAGHTPQTFAEWQAAGRPVPLYYIGSDGRAAYAGSMTSADNIAAYEQEAEKAAAAAEQSAEAV